MQLKQLNLVQLVDQLKQLYLVVGAVVKSLYTGNGPMDFVQVGKVVFVKESFASPGFEPTTFSCASKFEILT